MAKKYYLRKSLCLLLVFGIITFAGNDVRGAEAENGRDAKEKTYALTEAHLQSHIMSFAYRFASILDTAIVQFENLNHPEKIRYEVLGLMTLSLHHAFIIAGESEPKVSLLDMLSIVTLGRMFFEEEGQLRYGKVIVPVIDGYRRAEEDIRNVASKVITLNQVQNLMTIIEHWRKENPEVRSFPLIRFSNFSADRRESALTRVEDREGLFDSVESASETAEEMRLLAERGTYIATRLPQLFGLFGDLWLTRWMNNPDLQKTLADLSQLSEVSSRLLATSKNLPEQISKERKATIEQVMNSVSKERSAALAQVINESEELANHIMRLILVVIGGWFVAYVIAKLLILYVSNRMKASAI